METETHITFISTTTHIPFMHRDSNGNIIGRGELAAFEILMQIFPDRELKTQISLTSLLKGGWLDDLSDIQKKETLDIVIYGSPIIVVRIQDPHHRGIITSARDTVQRKTLEWNDIKVVDLQFYECVELLKDKVNSESMKEVLQALKDEKIY